MSDLAEVKELFQQAGLAFPKVPAALATRLKKRGEWLFSTRVLKWSPYWFEKYVLEAARPSLRDYALLAHTGHGVNSYALQYYLAHRGLRLLLHLGWGGVYMDPVASTAQVNECFSLADEIVALVTRKKREQESPLVVACSQFYGSYWPPGERRCGADRYDVEPAQVLREVLQWLQQSKG